jgi:hypothetical protein
MIIGHWSGQNSNQRFPNRIILHHYLLHGDYLRINDYGIDDLGRSFLDNF